MPRITGHELKSTARAWNISRKEVQNILDWIDSKVPEHQKSKAFATILKRNKNSNEQGKKV